jgi:hypothetical protein
MRSRDVLLAAGLVLALCPATSLAAGRPALSRLRDAYAGGIGSGSAFHGDGSRFVTFSDSGGGLVALDTRTNARSTVGLSPCGPTLPAPLLTTGLVGSGGPSVFYPSGLSAGLLSTFCYQGTSTTAPDQFQVIGLLTHASRMISFDPPATSSPFPDLEGPGTDGTNWAYVLGGSYGSLNHGYFNLTTGAIVEPVPAITTTEYEDLDSPRLTHRLCAPVTTAVDPPDGAGSNVIGFDRPWAVLEADSNALLAPLYAWRCGAKRPIRLGSTDPQHAQYGAGIVSWVGARGTLEATDLTTGRHWAWPARTGPHGTSIGWAQETHTANRIYAVPQVTAATEGEPQEIYTASLAGLVRPPAKH